MVLVARESLCATWAGLHFPVACLPAGPPGQISTPCRFGTGPSVLLCPCIFPLQGRPPHFLHPGPPVPTLQRKRKSCLVQEMFPEHLVGLRVPGPHLTALALPRPPAHQHPGQRLCVSPSGPPAPGLILGGPCPRWVGMTMATPWGFLLGRGLPSEMDGLAPVNEARGCPGAGPSAACGGVCISPADCRNEWSSNPADLR